MTFRTFVSLNWLFYYQVYSTFFCGSLLMLSTIWELDRLSKHWIRAPCVAASPFTSCHFIKRRWALLCSWWCSETLLRASSTWDFWRPRHSPISWSERCASLQLTDSKSVSAHFTFWGDSILTAFTEQIWCTDPYLAITFYCRWKEELNCDI